MDTPFFGFSNSHTLCKKYEFRNTKKNFHPLRICDSYLSYSLLNLNQQNDDEEKWKKNSTLFLYGSFVSLHFSPSFLARIHAKNSSQSTHKATTNDFVHCLVRTTFNSLCVKCEQKKNLCTIFFVLYAWCLFRNKWFFCFCCCRCCLFLFITSYPTHTLYFPFAIYYIAKCITS